MTFLDTKLNEDTQIPKGNTDQLKYSIHDLGL